MGTRSWLALSRVPILLPGQVMGLRGGVKRAAVKAEEDEDDAEDDGEVAGGSGAVSALTGVFANVRTVVIGVL